MTNMDKNENITKGMKITECFQYVEHYMTINAEMAHPKAFTM